MTLITNLMCEYRSTPLGIDVTVPRLSWQMETNRRGARQIAYRILAASTVEQLNKGIADLWDSGKIETHQSAHIPYAGTELISRKRVYWKVIVWDENQQENHSDSSWFEMGLLNRTDWKGEWIGAALSGGPRSTIPAPLLRRSFQIDGPIKIARLYVTALGLHECSINGHAVTEDVFAPGWTDYNISVQYQVYDIKHLLGEGENVLGVILGDGWAVGHISWHHRQTYFDRPRLLAQLEITMMDGHIVTIASDETWKHQFGPILENDMIMGEAYDARLELPTWDTPNFNDHRWLSVERFEDPGIKLVATNGPTVRPVEQLKPISDPVDWTTVTTERYIFDLGQNMVGRVIFKGSAPAGKTVTFRYAEVLNPDGTLYTANLRTARVIDYYTFKGHGEEVWQSKFTFHGFRYVEISGYPGLVNRDTITGVVLHSDLPATGFFECSDPLLNQLQHNIVWSQKGNFLDIPTDCPQRDERLGWTGDIQVFARTAAFNMEIAGFLTKWLKELAYAQGEQGNVPPVVPRIWLEFTEDGGPAWADAAVIVPWTIYLCYNDTRILEENYSTMTRFMKFVHQNASPDYIRCAPEYEGWPGLGDWLSINADTPRDFIGTAFWAYDVSLMARIAEALGKYEDVEHYQQLHSKIKQAFFDRYLRGSTVPVPIAQPSEIRLRLERNDAISRGNVRAVDYGPITSEIFNTDVFTPTQTAYVLALYFDLLPDNLRLSAAAELATDIKRRDTHLSTGFVGAPYLAHVLSSHGQLETAYALLFQKSWPSWLYSVTQGATTIWERWDGWTEEFGFEDVVMNSFNHYAYGSIGSWFYNVIAGIQPDPECPGYKHSILRPQPGGGLTHATGKLKTIYGELLSQWTINENAFEWSVIIPPNTTATIYLPERGFHNITLNGQPAEGFVHELVAGEYQFVVS